MRAILFSKTFDDQLIAYIEHGSARFGADVADSKKDIVYRTIESVIAHNPGIKRHDPSLNLVVYQISHTPFFILYDYDDREVRVHFIFINGKPLSGIDPLAASW